MGSPHPTPRPQPPQPKTTTPAPKPKPAASPRTQQSPHSNPQRNRCPNPPTLFAVDLKTRDRARLPTHSKTHPNAPRLSPRPSTPSSRATDHASTPPRLSTHPASHALDPLPLNPLNALGNGLGLTRRLTRSKIGTTSRSTFGPRPRSINPPNPKTNPTTTQRTLSLLPPRSTPLPSNRSQLPRNAIPPPSAVGYPRQPPSLLLRATAAEQQPSAWKAATNRSPPRVDGHKRGEPRNAPTLPPRPPFVLPHPTLPAGAPRRSIGHPCCLTPLPSSHPSETDGGGETSAAFALRSRLARGWLRAGAKRTPAAWAWAMAYQAARPSSSSMDGRGAAAAASI